MLSKIDVRRVRVSLENNAAEKLAIMHKLIVDGHLLTAIQVQQSRESKHEFWGEIGKDEIHWWVFKKEKNVQELKENTKNVLTSAKSLKDASRKLSLVFVPETYIELINALDRFVIDHEGEIVILYNYVERLHKSDALAPSMLLTYRVWGTTRQQDRISLNQSGHAVFCEDLQECLETTLGTMIRSKPTARWIWRELKKEMDIDGIEFKKFIESSKGANLWLIQTSRRTLDQLADYFNNILQSLRNILLEIDLYESVDNLLNDMQFWSKVILSTLRHPIETQLWDFKETLAMWHYSENKLSLITHFCEEVASFANSKGGVIIVGVSEKQHRRIVGVDDPENKIKFLSDVISKFCIYPKQFTSIHQVPLVGASGTILCIVIAIAQTKEVVSVVNSKGLYSFPKRSQTAMTRVDQELIKHDKSEVLNDNYNFISELYKISYGGFISFSYQ